MPSVVGRKVVASQSPVATYVGARVLSEGGNAFDAALAVSAVLSVVLPYTSGLGGDGFLLASTPEGKVAYNASGWAPSHVPDRIDKVRGPETVTVPGLVDLWNFLYTNYTTLPLHDLLKPAITLATEGFEVGKGLARAIGNARDVHDSWRRTFGGRKYGEILRLPGMGEVMKAISRDPREFYEGAIAHQLVNQMTALGVGVEFDDFSSFRGERIDPLRSSYGGLTLYELPPNSQGVTTLESLKLVELTSVNRMPFNDPERVRQHVRLFSLAYRDRDAHVADPRFHPFNPNILLGQDHLATLLSEDAKIDVKQVGDTTFFAVSDGENHVGFIQSLFHPFGSGLVVNDIPLQDRGAGFTSGHNRPEPRKRPLHTLSILMTEDDLETIIVGCAAGHLRPQIHSQVLEYYVDYKMEIDEAVYAPRFVLEEGEVKVERRLNLPFTQIQEFSPEVGVVQALKVRGRSATAVADPRSEGVALRA
jgi:gamma-glutamyltranspeptidase/glutathione hydrolase